MRFIILLFFFLLGICSCRSSRQSVTDYADTASVVIDEVKASHASDDILSLLSSSRELDLSGITIEFFPPDSAHPDSRAAPRTLSIENAKSKETTVNASHEQAAVDEQKTVNLQAQSSSDLKLDTRSNNDFLRPADWVIFFSMLASIIIFFVILLIKSKK